MQPVRDQAERLATHAPVLVLEQRRERAKVRSGGEEPVERGENLPPAPFHSSRSLGIHGLKPARVLGRFSLGLGLGRFLGTRGGPRLEEKQSTFREVGVSFLEARGDDRRRSLGFRDDILLILPLGVLLDRGDGRGSLATRSL